MLELFELRFHKAFYEFNILRVKYDIIWSLDKDRPVTNFTTGAPFIDMD